MSKCEQVKSVRIDDNFFYKLKLKWMKFNQVNDPEQIARVNDEEKLYYYVSTLFFLIFFFLIYFYTRTTFIFLLNCIREKQINRNLPLMLIYNIFSFFFSQRGKEV